MQKLAFNIPTHLKVLYELDKIGIAMKQDEKTSHLAAAKNSYFNYFKYCLNKDPKGVKNIAETSFIFAH